MNRQTQLRYLLIVAALLVAAPSLAFAGPVVPIVAAAAAGWAVAALELTGLAAIAFRVGFSLVVSSSFGKHVDAVDTSTGNAP
jgi:hypothetical protein